MPIESTYEHYYNYITDVINSNSLSEFKSNGHYQGILEHVSFQQGQEYLDLIYKLTKINQETIMEYCKENDKVGGGNKYNYGFITTSPTNFRYILHSHIILEHIRKLNMNNVNIVELGGGYGGLCLALNILSNHYNITITGYNLIDLPSISVLQKKYLEHHMLSYPIQCYSAFNFGQEIENNDNNFLISNYCFSEISSENQSMYIKTLFPKIKHGFMAWNWIPLYNFGFNYAQENEYPLTGPYNKFIYF
jgi:hypothetical protein